MTWISWPLRSKPVVAVRGLVRAKSIPSGLSLGATWWQHSTSASPSVGMTGDHVAGCLRAEKHYQVPKTFLIIAAVSLSSTAAPIALLQSARVSNLPYPHLSTSYGLTVSLPCWPLTISWPLRPWVCWLGLHTAAVEVQELHGRTLGTRKSTFLGLPNCENRVAFDMLLVSSSPLYFLPISPQR